MAYAFTTEQKDRFNHQAREQDKWLADRPQGGTVQVKTLHGVRVELCSEDVIETQALVASKLAILKDAIKVLQDAGLMFASGDVGLFRVVCYGGTGNVPSRGLVFFKTGESKPCVLVQLGPRLSRHVTKDPTSPQVVDGVTIVGGARKRPPRVLADRIYDYYKPTLTVPAKDKCALAQTLHELGHVFHQLTSPDDYWLNVDAAEGKSSLATFQRKTELAAVKSCGYKYISQYAGSDAKALNEYVAEVFAGMLMGIPWQTVDPSDKLWLTYVSLGGPVAATIPSPISRLEAFKSAACSCVANDHGESFKYW